MGKDNFETLDVTISEGRIDANTGIRCEGLCVSYLNKSRVDAMVALDFLTCRSRLLGVLVASCKSIIDLRNAVNYCNRELVWSRECATYLDSVGATYKSVNYVDEVAILEHHVDGFRSAISRLSDIDVKAIMAELTKVNNDI